MTLHLVLSVWRVLPKIICKYSLNLFHKNPKTIHCHWRAPPPPRQISWPNNIHTLWREKVMGIFKLITLEKMFWSFIHSLNQLLRNLNSGFITSRWPPELHWLLYYMWPATPDPPSLRNLAAPRLSQPPAFPELATFFKTFRNPFNL